MRILTLILCLLLNLLTNTSCHNSVKQIHSHPLTILSFVHSECLENCAYKSRLINQSFVDSIYHLTIAVHLNCNDDVITKAELKNDTLCLSIEIKPVKNEEGNLVIQEASCNCFFQYDFNIEGLKSSPLGFLINGLTFKENYDQNCEIIEIDSTHVY